MKEQTDDEIVLENETEDGAEAIHKLRERLKVCVKEKQEYLEGWQRARADFANEKKLTDARISDLSSFIQEETAEKVIALVDSFDMAFASANWNSVDESWRKGVESLREQALKILKDWNIESFSPMGEELDPAKMIPIQQIAGEKEKDGKVVGVERQGFKRGDKIVRPAYVSVGSTT